MMAPLDDARDEIAEIERMAREAFAAVGRMLHDLGTSTPAEVLGLDSLVREVQEASNTLAREIQEMIDVVNDEISHEHHTYDLRIMADEWQTLANDIGATAGNVGLDRLQAHIEWAGAASRAYMSVVPAQVDRLNQVSDACSQTARTLHGLADQIDSFWSAIKAAAVGVLIALTAVIYGWRGGPKMAAATIAAALLAVSAFYSIWQTGLPLRNALGDRMALEQRLIVQQLVDIGVSWPSARTETMSDASVTDGDGTDWRLEP